VDRGALDRGDELPEAVTDPAARRPVAPRDARAVTTPLPELAHVSRDEFRALREMAWLYAHRLTRSAALADDLTQRAFVLLYTTRRWNPQGETPLPRHLLGIVKSTVYNHRTSLAPGREAEAGAEFVRDRGETVGSPEDASLERDDAERRQTRAAEVLAELRARLSGHDVALTRLDLMAQGIEKPADQAESAGVPVQEIYRAREMTTYHLKKILAERQAAGDDE
jgi:DNA-directed RNA polymerase specialized sigma24 family protein